jgi:hypothetical protein
MTVKTWLDIHLEDGQKQKRTLSLRVKDIAFATAQTLPAAAKIEAVIDALFAAEDTPSNAKCVGYAIRVEQDVPGTSGGDGTSAITSAIRTRNDLGGIPGNWLMTIPAMNKSAVSFNPIARNQISTTGAMWDAVRAALADAAIAVGDPEATAYVATEEDTLFEVASGFDGRRAAPR